jgi:hypothetical protein
MKALVALAFSAAAGVVGVGASAAASGSPAARLHAAIAQGERQRSVHYVSRWSTSTTSVSMVGDAGRTAGIQRITYTKNGKSGHVTVLVVADTAYVRGDAFTLENYLGFSAAEAAKAAGKWLLLPHTEQGFASIAAGVRLSSTLAQLELQGPVTAVKGSRGEAGFRGLHAYTGSRVRETVYAHAAGSRLPVELVVGGAQPAKLTFSRWNEALHLSAPASGAGSGGNVA